jgi:hypothetical protein
MKTNGVIISIEDLELFLRKTFKGFNTKDYEMIVAIILARLHTKMEGQIFDIGFPVDSGKIKKIGFSNSIKHMSENMRAYIDENTPVDTVIVSRDQGDKRIKKGYPYQIKRFICDKNDITEDVIDYLINKIPKDYTKTQTGLVLIIESTGLIDLSKIKNACDFVDYPFEVIRFMLMPSNDKLVFGEIWPGSGKNEYSLKDWLN